MVFKIISVGSIPATLGITLFRFLKRQKNIFRRKRKDKINSSYFYLNYNNINTKQNNVVSFNKYNVFSYRNINDVQIQSFNKQFLAAAANSLKQFYLWGSNIFNNALDSWLKTTINLSPNNNSVRAFDATRVQLIKLLHNANTVKNNRLLSDVTSMITLKRLPSYKRPSINTQAGFY